VGDVFVCGWWLHGWFCFSAYVFGLGVVCALWWVGFDSLGLVGAVFCFLFGVFCWRLVLLRFGVSVGFMFVVFGWFLWLGGICFFFFFFFGVWWGVSWGGWVGGVSCRVWLFGWGGSALWAGVLLWCFVLVMWLFLVVCFVISCGVFEVGFVFFWLFFFWVWFVVVLVRLLCLGGVLESFRAGVIGVVLVLVRCWRFVFWCVVFWA